MAVPRKPRRKTQIKRCQKHHREHQDVFTVPEYSDQEYLDMPQEEVERLVTQVNVWLSDGEGPPLLKRPEAGEAVMAEEASRLVPLLPLSEVHSLPRPMCC